MRQALRRFCFLAACLLALVMTPATVPVVTGATLQHPTYLIAVIPLNWSGSWNEFEEAAKQEVAFFLAQSNLEAYANVELHLVTDELDSVSLDDPWLVQEVVAFGLLHQPADRYIGLTDGDLSLDGDGSVAGWTMGPDSLGVVVEANWTIVTAHELGHSFGLCDEYYYPYWEEQNREWQCPNPFPPECPPIETEFCDGAHSADGRNSIMGPAGLAGDYTYNQPSLSHLHTLFAAMFPLADPPLAPTTEPSPTPPPTPEPTLPSPQQPIALADPNLVRLEPDGRRQQLAAGPAYHPDWSPDGQWIVFAAAYEGNLDLYLVSAGGGSPRQLTDRPAREMHPAWFPDSRHFIYVSDDGGLQSLYLFDLEDGQSRPLPDLPAPATWPAVSGDGQRLAFSAAPDGEWLLYQVELDTDGLPLNQTVECLIEGIGPAISPAWSPDGSALAFAMAGDDSLDLFLYSFADGTTSPLVMTPASEWAPRWLADGQLLYQAYDGHSTGLWLFDPAQATIRPFVTDVESAAWPAVGTSN